MNMPVVNREFRDDLRETARGFLARSASTRVTRDLIEGAGDRAGLEGAVAELGWLGVEVPEEHGGLGAGYGELAIILQELGRVVSPLAVASTTALGVGAVLHAAPASQARWLPAIASGEARITAALTGTTGEPDAVDVVARPAGDGWRLDGVAGWVWDLAGADAVAVAARHDAGCGESVFLLALDAAGVAVEDAPTIDLTRRLARLDLRDVVVAPAQRLGEQRPADTGDDVARLLRERGALALAADSVGGAERVLEFTVEHLQTRRQFGRPLGSFQALKHRCVDMYLAIETARVAVEHAADLLALRANASTAVSIAKATAGAAYGLVAAEGVQLLGGIGFTWEHDVHLHLKRARLAEALLGDAAWHRELLARVALEAA